MYRKINADWIKHIDFELIDIACIELSFLLSYFLRHKEFLSYNWNLYKKLGLVLIFLDIVVVFFSENYKGIVQRGEMRELSSVIRHVTTVDVLLLLYEYVVKEADIFSRMVFLFSWGMSIILCFLARTAWKNVVRKRITSERNQRKMILISSKDRVSECINELYKKEFRDFRISAVCVMETGQEEVLEANIPIFFGYDRLIEYSRLNVVDEVYIDTFSDKETLNEMIDIFLSMGITVHVGMGFLPEGMPNKTIEKFGSVYSITTSVKAASDWELNIKRLIDVIGSIVGLFLCAFAFIFVAPAIKISSKGKVFFKQERVGKNGRVFQIYKFRSMYPDAEDKLKEVMNRNEMQGLMFKLENDPRIIGSEKGPGKGIGNFIRRTSIDELPQFWNILKGEMSLVGTRPPTITEYEQYDVHHKIRLCMKPGLTGMWQVNGRNDITDFENVVKLDTYYIENWNLGLDMKILLKTIKVVCTRKGSK